MKMTKKQKQIRERIRLRARIQVQELRKIARDYSVDLRNAQINDQRRTIEELRTRNQNLETKLYSVENEKYTMQRELTRLQNIKERLAAYNASIGPGNLTVDEVEMLAHGRFIDCIKLVRERTQLGLKESKDLVEMYDRSHPGLRKHPTTPTPSGISHS